MSDANLLLRSSIWYARLSAPATLQRARQERGQKPRADLFRSLRTGDKLEARRRLAAKLVEMRDLFTREEADLRQRSAAGRVPDEHELEIEAFRFVQQELREDERERASRPTQLEKLAAYETYQLDLQRNPPTSPLDALARESGFSAKFLRDPAMYRGDLRDALVESLQVNSFHLIDWAIQDAAAKNGWLLPPESHGYRFFGRLLIQKWLSALGTQTKRDQGVYEEAASVTVLPHSAHSGPSTGSDPVQGKPKKGETLADYFERYLSEARSNLKRSGLQDARATLRQFVEASGNRPVTSYTRADMSKFKRLLRDAPAQTEKLFPGVPFPKAVEQNRKKGHPKLRAASVRNKISTLRTFGAWLENNVDGVDAANFKTDLPPKTDSQRMEPFSPQEVRSILNAKAFVGCESERNQQKPGLHKIRDWRFWVPMIAAFTGARLNEIVQLAVTDVRQVDGVWAFSISDEGRNQSLKNKQSRRDVAIHPQLMALGILEWHQQTVEAGARDLFHQIPLDRDGRRSTNAGKVFRRFLTRIGVKGADSLGGMHRWRHTLTDALRAGGVDDYDAAQVLGHKVDVAKMTGHYGRTVGSLSMAARAEMLAKANYPSVDFSLLAPHADTQPDAT